MFTYCTCVYICTVSAIILCWWNSVYVYPWIYSNSYCLQRASVWHIHTRLACEWLWFCVLGLRAVDANEKLIATFLSHTVCIQNNIHFPNTHIYTHTHTHTHTHHNVHIAMYSLSLWTIIVYVHVCVCVCVSVCVCVWWTLGGRKSHTRLLTSPITDWWNKHVICI